MTQQAHDSGPGRRRTAVFPPEVASVPASRRYVRQVLQDTGHEEWLDAAQLAVSEVATNAVLHAHTAFEVTVHTTADHLHVLVWDDETAQPVRRTSGPDDTTGRGLDLVAAVVDGFGVDVVGPSKVVWFSLGTDQPPGGGGLLMDRWHAGDEGTGRAAELPRREVHLLGMPYALWLSARRHHNTLMREYALHQQALHATPGRIPDELVAADRARSLVLTSLRAAPEEPTADLVLLVGEEQGRWFAALRDVLDAAEVLAAAGELLAEPGPPLVVAVRRWASGQVLDQLAGLPPTRWAGPVALPPGPAAPVVPVPAPGTPPGASSSSP